jgi:hypothetical protein
LAIFAGTAVPLRAVAAHIEVRAPRECVEASSIAEQVDGILGQPLTAVAGVDFEVAIAEGPRRRWRLRLDTIEQGDGSRRTRELTAQTCAELVDAAAVSIAMSIKSTADTREARRGAAPATESATAPGPAGAPSAELQRAATPAAAPPPPARKSLAFAAVADAGAMPKTGFGVGIEGALRFRALRIAGTGALFLAQQTRIAGNVGGDFQLAVGGLLVCFTGDFGRLTLLGCGGPELGRLSGEGVGVSNPRSRGALWMAGRAEVGGTLALGPRLALLLRAGAAVPALRPKFVLDGTTEVHRPDAVTARATVALAARGGSRPGTSA